MPIVPTAGLIETEVAPVVAQDNVLLWPAMIVEGMVVKLEITGGGGGPTGVTVTVVCAVADPLLPLPVAVRVYVVVTAGLTDTEPEVVMVPTPGVIDTALAPEVAQESTLVPPALIVDG